MVKNFGNVVLHGMRPHTLELTYGKHYSGQKTLFAWQYVVNWIAKMA